MSINSFDSHKQANEIVTDYPLTVGHTERQEKLRNLLKVTGLISSRARILIWTFWLQILTKELEFELRLSGSIFVTSM